MTDGEKAWVFDFLIKIIEKRTAETSKKIVETLTENSNVVMAIAQLYNLAVSLKGKREADWILKKCGIYMETEDL